MSYAVLQIATANFLSVRMNHKNNNKIEKYFHKSFN